MSVKAPKCYWYGGRKSQTETARSKTLKAFDASVSTIHNCKVLPLTDQLPDNFCPVGIYQLQQDERCYQAVQLTGQLVVPLTIVYIDMHIFFLLQNIPPLLHSFYSCSFLHLSASASFRLHEPHQHFFSSLLFWHLA